MKDLDLIRVLLHIGAEDTTHQRTGKSKASNVDLSLAASFSVHVAFSFLNHAFPLSIL
jgi:hypothetical protein